MLVTKNYKTDSHSYPILTQYDIRGWFYHKVLSKKQRFKPNNYIAAFMYYVTFTKEGIDFIKKVKPMIIMAKEKTIKVKRYVDNPDITGFTVPRHNNISLPDKIYNNFEYFISSNNKDNRKDCALCGFKPGEFSVRDCVNGFMSYIYSTDDSILKERFDDIIVKIKNYSLDVPNAPIRIFR